MQILSLVNLALIQLCDSGRTMYFFGIFIVNMDFLFGKA